MDQKGRRPLAERWTEAEGWKAQTAPTPIGAKEGYLDGVSCPSSTACTAVGFYTNSSSVIETLAEHWAEAEGWKIQTTADPAGAAKSILTNVSCSSPTACSAVGEAEAEGPIAEHWSGSEWTLQRMPLANEAYGGYIEGISCTSPRVCTSVGTGGGEYGGGALLEHETFPTAISEASTGVIVDGAMLHGTLNSEESNTRYRFEYGTSTSYGMSTQTGYIDLEEANIKVSQAINQLKGGTTYHYRIIAINQAGRTYGEDKTFTTLSAEWRLDGALFTESVATGWKGKIKLSEPENNTVVECENTAEGSVTPGVAGEITKWPKSTCVGVKTCENGSTVEALNLPWHTELVTVEGVTREVLTGTGHGEPGYKLACKYKGIILYESKCTASALNMTTTNGASGVTAKFLGTEKLSCGGASIGTLEGTQTIETSKGGKLSAVNATEAAKLSEADWRLDGALFTESVATGWKGKIKLSEPENNTVVECENTAEGSVTPGVAGEITKWPKSTCVGVKTCENGSTVEALNLPWHTELVTVEGVTREVLTGTGHGEPGYKLACKYEGIILYESKCTASALNMTTTNGASGVTAKFLGTEKLSCGGASIGTLEGTQTIETSKGGKLSAVNATEAAKLSEAGWHLGGFSLTESVAVGWKGKIKLSEPEMDTAVECENTAEGSLMTNVAGEITKWPKSTCVGVNTCENGSTVEGVNLPWYTALVTVEGVTREVLTGTGHGEPGYKLVCKVAKGEAYAESTCTASAFNTTTTNGTTGVTATFLASEKLHRGIYACTLEGTQTIEASKGGKLEVT